MGLFSRSDKGEPLSVYAYIDSFHISSLPEPVYMAVFTLGPRREDKDFPREVKANIGDIGARIADARQNLFESGEWKAAFSSWAKAIAGSGCGEVPKSASGGETVYVKVVTSREGLGRHRKWADLHPRDIPADRVMKVTVSNPDNLKKLKLHFD